MGMGTVINTNVMSLNAQRNLGGTGDQLATSLERLSSGLRINSARDDAAGLAISERFTAQVNGQDQAVRNSNDGISFAQTAEGALDEVSNLAQRVRELAVQSANDTNSASDREALDQEVQASVNEIQRIATSTQFNDQNILDGSLEDLIFQVGANRGQTISTDGVDARTSELGVTTIDGNAVNLEDLEDLDDGDLTINGEEIDLGDVSSVDDVVTAINEASEETDVNASRITGGELTATTEISSGDIASANDTITINDVEVTAGGTSLSDLVSAINDNEELAGQGITADEDEDVLVLRGSSDVSEITIEDGDIADSTAAFERGFELDTELGEDITLEGDSGDLLSLGLLAVGETDSAEVLEATDNALEDTNVLTRENAEDAIRTSDEALQQISSLRSELGATQNRFDATIANLSIGSENLQAARSRIEDADFAEETANLTRGQVLQQAGTSVLAQANQIPQNVLGLLQ